MPETLIITGKVKRGDGKGAEIGFPTANLELESGTLPPEGIWAGWAQLGNESTQLPAAIHIGPRPTLADETPRFEVFLINFAKQDLYGQLMKVEVVTKIRDIAKFESTTELSEQIKKDVEKTCQILEIKP